MAAVANALRALSQDRNFQEDLRDPEILRAIRHWSGVERLQLSEEETEAWADNYRLMGVWRQVQRLQGICRVAGVPVPLEQLLRGEAELPRPPPDDAALPDVVVLTRLPPPEARHPRRVSLVLRDADKGGEDVFVSVKESARLQSLLEEYVLHRQLPVDPQLVSGGPLTLRHARGATLVTTQTVKSTGLADDDVLSVVGVPEVRSLKAEIGWSMLRALSLVALAFVVAWVNKKIPSQEEVGGEIGE